MENLKILLLGIFQGIAEFLPISSSGHLAILQKVFGFNNIDQNITLDILLHLGTLISIFLVYYKEIIFLICEAWRLIVDICNCKPDWFKNDDRKLIVMIAISCLPTGILGIIIENFADRFKNDTTILGICLLLTAIILFLSESFEKGKKDIKDATLKDGFIMGIVQGIAVIPGISRSGSTITAGMSLGLNKENAIRFSFFMSMPIILLAALKDFFVDGGVQTIQNSYIFSMIASIITGYFSIKILIKVIKDKHLSLFGYYCAIAGLITIFLI